METDNKIELKLISDEIKDTDALGYIERTRIYECPCGEGTIIWSKERPTGQSGYHESSFSDVFIHCENCKDKYNVKSYKGYAVPK